MRVRSNHARWRVGFNMTPMIDVVFQLIIFFLVSSHLAKQEVQLNLDLPKAASGQRPEEDETRRIVVNVLPQSQPEGQFMVSGVLMNGSEVSRMIGFESGRADRRLEIRIRTDRRVRYATVEPVMIACARAGVWKVTFAVMKE